LRPCLAAYGLVMLMASVAYYILARRLIAHHGRESALARAIGRDVKGLISTAIYVVAILAAFIHPWISCGLYVAVAIIWLVPDRRIERSQAAQEA
jgi:uncharacterized membrane protein